MPNVVVLQNRPFYYKITDKECWEVTNFKPGDKGYFLVRFAEGRKYLHRLSYQTFKGELIKNLLIRHMCNNSLCINPEHLEQGTSNDNVQDAVRAGAYIKDTCIRNHDLTEPDALWSGERPSGKRYRVCKKCAKIRLDKYNGTV